MGESRVHDALLAVTARLDELAIPYAILGAMALNAYGYVRATVDVDILVTREGLERFRAAMLGRGYVEKFPGSRGLRDSERNVDISTWFLPARDVRSRCASPIPPTPRSREAPSP